MEFLTKCNDFLTTLGSKYEIKTLRWSKCFTPETKKRIHLTKPWWLSGLMCQSIINPMLKVEGSNPGASILKFGLFQFSKWLCLDKNNKLEISVALLVLND